MTKCNFCGSEESSFKGVNQIRNDGSIVFFCSSKCRKNTLNLRRDRKKIKWTEAFRISKRKAVEKQKQKAESEAKKEPKTEEKREEVKKSKK